MSKSKAVVVKDDLGVLVAAMPEVPPFNAPAVAADIRALNEQATSVLESAQRAVIATKEAAEVGTELLKAINTRIGEVDDARKAVTGKFDKLVKGVNALFTTGPTAKLTTAKTVLQNKLGDYARAERVKAEAAAEAERKRIAEEAAAQAAAAIEEGDTEGALEIIHSAANVEVEPEKVQVRSTTAMLSSTTRKVGMVMDLRALLKWVAETNTPAAMALLGGISVGQRELNQLAVSVFAARKMDPAYTVPGFVPREEETFGAR